MFTSLELIWKSENLIVLEVACSYNNSSTCYNHFSHKLYQSILTAIKQSQFLRSQTPCKIHFSQNGKIPKTFFTSRPEAVPRFNYGGYLK